MITVNLPDGTVAQFPDGTSKEVMKSAIAKRFPPQKNQKQEMLDRVAAAKAGTLEMQPGSAEVAQAANAAAMSGMDMQPVQKTGPVLDAVMGGSAGLARGLAGIPDMPGALLDLYMRGVSSGVEKLGTATGAMTPETAANIKQGMRETTSMLPTGSGKNVRGLLSTLSGGATDYQAQTTPGKYAQTVGEFLPGAAIGGASPANLLKYGVIPGLASEAAGQATQGTAYEPYARAGAALAAPLAVGAIDKLGRAIVSPYGGADPERLKLAKVLEDFGVSPTAGQRTGSEALRKSEGATAAGQDLMATQADDFTAAALKTIGTDAKRATPEVLQASAKRIGADFDAAIAGIDVVPDANALGKFSATMQNYRAMAPKDSVVPLIGNINKQLVRAFRSGNAIPASELSTWRSGLSKLTTSADAATREAAVSAMNVIDDTMEAALTAAGRVDDIQKLATARGQWRNFLAIQKAASRSGEGVALGVISPSSLRNEVANQGRAAIAQGKRGDIGALARAGEAVLKPLPAVSAGGIRTVDSASAIARMMAGGAIGGVPGTVVAFLAPGLLGAAKMTGPAQAYLANQLVAPGGPIMSAKSLSSIPGLLARKKESK